MTDFSDPKRTRLPKLLKAMENDNLVVSALQPGPLGPYRRIYEPGPNAKDYLVESLQIALETMLHFYDSFRTSQSAGSNDKEEAMDDPPKSGKILFASYPQVNVNDLNEIRNLSANRDVSISIIGTDEILSKAGISYDVVGDTIINIESPSKTFTEVHLRGLPPKESLSDAVTECKRVLVRGGILRIIAPFAFFDKPKKGSLEEFIRTTAANQFPELGVVEGNDILQVIKQNFSKHGTSETSLGEVEFWAIKP